MYKTFFGFKERPFKLVPDPAYLYLGQSHEDALGHLNYAVRQGDGFVVITGEVGTGKTTVCRMFLEKLDDSSETAYIFNPKLDALQLLKAINDEFCIDASPANTKDLIDILNHFLMDKKQQGKRAILIIDEAQNLSTEVLEQIRLLSNLETTKAKLLQIILVGQPELGEKLDSFELRQLEQRITLNCHLNPLTYKETGEYISHRIQIASHKNNILFTKAAIRKIFQYSGGIPRLINIVCDRALLCAFSRDTRKITKGITALAIRELSGKRQLRTVFFDRNRKAVFVLIALVFVLGVLLVYPPVNLKESKASSDHAAPVVHKIIIPQKKEISKKKQPSPKLSSINNTPDAVSDNINPIKIPPMTPEKQIVIYKGEDLESLLLEAGSKSSRDIAMRSVLSLWKAETGLNSFLQGIENHSDYFVLASKQNQLNVQKFEGDLELVKNLNYAAILELYAAKSPAPIFLALVKVENDHLVFEYEGKLIQVSKEDLLLFWKNRFYVIWKNFYGYSEEIQVQNSGNSVLILKRHLQEIGYPDIILNTLYDATVRNAIKDIQKRYGLSMDGIVGPLTIIALYNESRSLVIPHLRQVL
jgi:general secretion pathway protein A